MPGICRQSIYDAIVDCGGMDSILTDKNYSDEECYQRASRYIDHLQTSLRLGNILVCISKLPKDKFCKSFDEKFGWVQELDGDPGEISAWYRGKTNIAAQQSKFSKLGLHMYVYTNCDNC